MTHICGLREKNEEDIYAAMIQIDKLCLVTPTSPPLVPTMDPPTRPTLASGLPEHTDAAFSHPVKLPKLKLWPFNGDVINWTLWGSLEPAVHKNATLPDIDTQVQVPEFFTGT